MSLKRTALLFVSVAVALGALAPVPASAQQLTKVRINKIPIAPYVPTEVALSRGWFKEEGLDVSIDAVAAGAVAIQGVAGGKLDVIYTSLDIGLRSFSRGFDVVILSNQNNAQMKGKDAAAILVRKDSGIKTPKDLEGKRVLVNNLQNVNWAYTREAVMKAGGDPNKVQFLEVNFPQMVDALLGNQADAASITEPFTTIGQGTGKLDVLSYMYVDVQPGLNVAGWVASGKWVRENPKAAQAFRRVIQRAIDLLENNPEEKTKALLQFTPLKADLLQKITLDKWTTKLEPSDLQKQLEVYKRQGLIDKVYDVKTIIVP
jgi:NitT/TauT family transport system substrate-binding protein